jgi:hypothetical protein
MESPVTGNFFLSDHASDVQTTINLLQQCITQSTEEVFGNRQVALGKAIKHSYKPWFDTECCQTKS